jgi:hypothetical protein
MRDNGCLKAALEELALAGVREVTHAQNAKSYQVRWQSMTGAPRMLSVSITPSDHFAPSKVRADVRRILRADGMLIDRPAPAPKPPDRMTRLEQRLSALELEVAQLRNGGTTT